MNRIYHKKTQPTKSCDRCGSPFAKSARLSGAQWAARRYCSQKCTGEALAETYANDRPSLRDKFDSLFEMRDDGCWEWQGTIDGYGYGVIDLNRKRYRAHVLALEFDGRPVQRGQIACHHCDNPRCVRPDHLYPGTAADNARDASVRGRLLLGERNSNAKLTAKQVRDIRAISGVPVARIARQFGVSRPTVRRIQERVIWRHVP